MCPQLALVSLQGAWSLWHINKVVIFIIIIIIVIIIIIIIISIIIIIIIIIMQIKQLQKESPKNSGLNEIQIHAPKITGSVLYHRSNQANCQELVTE